jgi:large subunit ribosomal protein L10
MPSQKNIDYVQTTKDQLKSGKAFYFTDFTGLSVQNLEALRRELKKNSAVYVVLKNTLGYLAIKDLGFDETLRELFVGPTGIAIAYDDPVVLAKILKETKDLKIKGCYIEGTFFDANAVMKLSQIPSKDVLLSSIIGSLNLVGNLVGILEGILRNVIYTIDSMKNKEAK